MIEKIATAKIPAKLPGSLRKLAKLAETVTDSFEKQAIADKVIEVCERKNRFLRWFTGIPEFYSDVKASIKDAIAILNGKITPWRPGWNKENCISEAVEAANDFECTFPRKTHRRLALWLKLDKEVPKEHHFSGYIRTKIADLCEDMKLEGLLNLLKK